MGSRNGDIRGFFKPKGPSSSQPQSQPASSLLSTSELSSPPDISSPPRTPFKSSASRSFSRDAEIKGSDESDDDSDDSLGSITDALGYRARPAAHQRDPSVLSTPQAKRIASGVHRSPLTLQPKRHKFDLKALISHSREIERTEESARQADALIAQAAHKSDNSEDSDAENDPRRLEEAARHLFVGTDEEEGKGDKLRRAFKRSKNDGTSSRKHCYFFTQEEPPSKAIKNAFPRKKAVGCWKCLSKSDARPRTFTMGLPHVLLTQRETLPDEIFLWILDEICTEQNAELQRQYINLAEICKDNTNRLVDDMRLYAWLEGLGGPEYDRGHIKLRSTTEVRHEYLERNWSPLVTFLQLLSRIAPNLQPPAAISAVQLLLRMSMDPVVAVVVREQHMCALAALVSSLAKSRSRWNRACEAICSYVYESIDDLELKVTCIISIPSSSLSLVDLRRRLAAESLFNRPGLGRKPIDSRLSFEKIRDRLDTDDFRSTNRPNFDYERLRALTTLLDIVIDRAEFMRAGIRRANGSAQAATTTSSSNPGPTIPAAQTRPPNPCSSEADADRQFDAQIDVLATRVKVIHDKIRDKASRKNVKLSLLGLEKRLLHAVRTRPPPRREIFAFNDENGPSAAAEANVPKQRDFMRQWAQKKRAEKQQEEHDHDDEGGDDDDVMEPIDIMATQPRRTRRDIQVAA
ncbi:hypothetical protein F4777DRAFT_525928 [Nemania sp. FL0916]|nr:hypothetical protein F4777DRAFT_525928 [Nemania sp. FL0916]